jgi:hypothetical protein
MAYNAGIVEEKDVLTLQGRCGAAVSPYRLLKAGTDPDEVIHATNQNSPFEGVSDNASENGAATYLENDPIRIKYRGIIYIEMTGTGDRGDRVTSGATGLGAKHTTQQGAWIFGFAEQAWTSGQIIPVRECQHYIGSYAT